MKKLILSIITAVTLFAVCFLCACGPAVESIELSTQTISVKCNQSAELTYTVTPENGSVKVEVSEEKIATYSNGKVTGVTVGTAIVKVYAKGNEEIFQECRVTVAPPLGYAAYSNESYKFVYPTGWTRSSQSGVTIYKDSTSTKSVNIVSEPKNTAYWTMTPTQYRETLRSQYQILGYAPSFSDVTIKTEKYLGISRVRITAEYTLSGQDIYQEQIVQSNDKNTYVLTITAPKTETELFLTISEQFIVA